MIVEKIEYSDKYNLVRLFISREQFFVSYDFFNNLKIDIDDDLDFDLFKEIVEEDEYNRCKNFALRQISYSQKTSFDIRTKLLKKKYSKEAIEKTLDFLEEYKLVDDEAYVKAYVNDKSKLSSWSKKKIFYKLKAKSIPDFLINKYLENIPEEEEYAKAYALAERKVRGDFSFENKQKVYRYLAGRGFTYDIISKCVGELFK